MNRKKYEKQAEDGAAMLRKAMDGKTVTVQEMPKPQPYLTSNGKKIFKAICAHLIEHNILCAIDSFRLSMIANAFDEYAEMASEINRLESIQKGTGRFQIFANGTKQKSTEMQVKDSAESIIKAGCVEFGLTVKARESILAFAKVGEPEDEGDELDLYAKVKQALADKNRQS